MEQGKLYSLLASRIQAMANCVKANNQEWLVKHREHAEQLVKQFMPSGSGIDTGTKLCFEESTGEKLVFTFGFHHMNDAGMYDGWTEHKAIVTPSLQFGFNLKITGRDRNGIKDYLHETFSADLYREIFCELSPETKEIQFTSQS